ncbi:hypothetical protein PoB_003688000 [Plakobranchus ocellatus]|uniref:Uncharacterized protein n=1 Tax=Plakobranchus ocellatus TaxID=259542 RepID=A0AAV4AQ40_9GAST|nr:hypothetical protein PoB_003688000 [Plakobranchus ocellatus]
MFACTNRNKDAWERFWPAVDERSITRKLHHQVLNHSIASLNQPISLRLSSPGLESFSHRQRQSGGRQADSRAFLAAAIETPGCFWRPPF